MLIKQTSPVPWDKTLRISPNKKLNVNESFVPITTKVIRTDDDDDYDETELDTRHKIITIESCLSPSEVRKWNYQRYFQQSLMYRMIQR